MINEELLKLDIVKSANKAGQEAAIAAMKYAEKYQNGFLQHTYMAAFYTAITGVLSVDLDKSYFTELVTNISKLANKSNEDKSFERLEFLIDHQAIIGQYTDTEQVTHYRVESAGHILHRNWETSPSAAIDAAILESAE